MMETKPNIWLDKTGTIDGAWIIIAINRVHLFLFSSHQIAQSDAYLATD